MNTLAPNPADCINKSLSALSKWYEEIECISHFVTPAIAKVATVFLALAIVLGVLMIIPTIIQSVSMYFWDVQIKQEHTILATFQEEEKNLFIYRLVCYVVSFVVLCLSTLPTLILIVAREIVLQKNVTRRLYSWGWCHFFFYSDMATRLLVTGIVVVPLLEFFILYCRNVICRGESRVRNIFAVIVRSVIPMVILCFLLPIPIVAFLFTKGNIGGTDGHSRLSGEFVCEAGPLFEFYFYFEFFIMHVIPCLILIIIIPICLRYLEGREYGILYEPLVYLGASIPLLVTKMVLLVYRLRGFSEIFTSTALSNSLLLSTTLYHMSFSAIFLLFTIKNVVQEIREERALKRRRTSTLLRGQATESTNNAMRKSMRRHYSVVVGPDEQGSKDTTAEEGTATGKQAPPAKSKDPYVVIMSAQTTSKK